VIPTGAERASQEADRANQEAERANQEAERANQEADRANAAEILLEQERQEKNRLLERLRQLGLEDS